MTQHNEHLDALRLTPSLNGFGKNGLYKITSGMYLTGGTQYEVHVRFIVV
jgi:hypothetical protein